MLLLIREVSEIWSRYFKVSEKYLDLKKLAIEDSLGSLNSRT